MRFVSSFKLKTYVQVRLSASVSTRVSLSLAVSLCTTVYVLMHCITLHAIIHFLIEGCPLVYTLFVQLISATLRAIVVQSINIV